MTDINPYKHHYTKHSRYYHYTIVWIVLVFCIFFVLQSSAFLSKTLSQTTKTIATQTKNIVAQTIGDPMQKDNNGNINILLIWYGGSKHQWWFLADSIIVASFDPEEYSISMISIPRDLIVNDSWAINRINTVMAYNYNKTKDLDSAAQALAQKITQITSLSIPYYALVDFYGFEDFIDQIWGIDVYVPQKVYDSTYPWPNYSYTTFSINPWFHHLDGSTALKYARSRHSTSDFSRSQRQQIIIKAIINKAFQNGISISLLTNLYNTYKSFVHTNITIDEVLGLLAYGKTIPTMHNFWLTMECGISAPKLMHPWCFLTSVDSAQFWWMAGLLPIGASISKISYYDLIAWFSDMVVHNQWYLNENLPITLFNATDSTYAKKFPYRDQLSTKLGVKLKRYGFAITWDINKSEKIYSGTTIQITGTGNYQETVDMLKKILPIHTIEINPATVDLSWNTLPNGIAIYLGNDILDLFGKQPFSSYRINAQ